ncbi:MAG: hypothetical protein ABIN89_04670 [Chitinophagaceae bacterium]
MLNENTNNGLNWKDRLEELDSLPGETFSGKGEAWEKLLLRLRSNKRRRKAAWYWVAAACLGIIIILVTTWSKNTKEAVLVNVNTAIIKSKKPVVNTSSVFIKKDGSDISEAPAKRRPVKTITEKAQSGRTENITGKNNTSGLSINVSSAESLPELLVNTAAPGDTVVLNKTPVFVKEKLRVVHNNELGMPVEEDSRKERYAERPSYYKRLTNSNQDAFTNTSVNSHAFSNDIFKIKISPQN